MGSLNYIRHAIKLWSKRWGSYTIFVLLINQFITWILLPLIQSATSFILQINHVPFISYNNILPILTQHPLAILELLLILVILLLFTYFQFSLLFIGIENILNTGTFAFLPTIKSSFRSLTLQKLKGTPLFILYLLLIIPFGRVSINSPFLAKVRIPIFVLDDLLGKWWAFILISLFVIVTFYLAIRLLRTLPLAILHNYSFKKAMKESWQETNHHFWFYFWRIFLISILSIAITWTWTQGLVIVQTFLDKTPLALPGAIITMTLIQIGLLVWNSLITVITIFLLIYPQKIVATANYSKKIPTKKRWWIRGLAILGITLIATTFAFVNFEYMSGALDSAPKVISHRGVNNKNGVQNTIPALLDTAKKHPDYVEIDIHQTKDKKFVVMHDPNLKALAGINKTNRELTLKQLTQITVKENGHTAKIPSFDEYLSTAEKIKQPLIVEVKTTDQDTKDVIKLFLEQYANRLIKDGYPIHSLDYRVIAQAKKYYPKLFASFILPYNLVLPQTKADAYTAEETTISTDLVDTAQAKNKKIWAWTVDDSDDMRSMIFLNVDGIITDDMDNLLTVLNQENAHPSYAQRLKNYAKNLNLMQERSGVEN